MDNLLPDYIFESCNNRPITTHVCIYLTIRSDPRVHLDNKSIERDTCRLLLSEDYIDMEAKTWNKVKGDEVKKKLHMSVYALILEVTLVSFG